MMRSRLAILLCLLALPTAAAPQETRPRRAEEVWSLQPVRDPAPPTVKHAEACRSPIDRFVLQKLEEKGLSPAPPADPQTLIRRVTFDLTGLPPTPGEIDAFVSDPAPNAYERLVDRLLASPRYGERWGRHWLDVARYSESQGFERDKVRPNAWHYRDYVIRSFNEDKPYDRFVAEQIAGDVLEPVTTDGIVATSFLVCGSYDEVGHTQKSELMKARVREEELEDLVSVVAQGFLGMTVNCARCHDHKFAPIPQADYYRLKSAFEGIRHGERPVAVPGLANEHAARIARAEASIAETRKKIGEIDAGALQAALAKRGERPRPPGPAPIARWNFASGGKDTVGKLSGNLAGGARIAEGRLLLDGKSAFLSTAQLPWSVREKTLEAWVRLSTLDQGGGAAISIENRNGAVFDAIVFGERQRRRWTAGSNNFVRTRDLQTPEEQAGPSEPVHVAVAYRTDGEIQVYRNGERYGESYKAGEIQTFMVGDAKILIGKRHTGGGNAFLAADIHEASLYDRALSAAEVRASFASSALHVPAEEIQEALAPELRARRQALAAELDVKQQERKAIPSPGLSYTGLRAQPPPTHRLVRGDVQRKSEAVSTTGLSAVREPPADFGLAPDAPEAQRRLKLAAWITDPRNPLTARVMANRVWHYHFGRGIVGTPSDLGPSGEPPSHPELLDWLASRFVEGAYSVKKLHRLILSSATYRQSSRYDEASAKVDAGNVLLWRFSPRRLEGEAVRDALLFVSGRLNLEAGGPSFQPFDTFIDNSHFHILKDKTAPAYERRSVYRMNVNSAKDPLMAAFDAPDTATKTPARPVTMTPQQALALMNNPFVQRQVRIFAERVERESAGDRAEAVRRAYRHALGRPPTAEESARALVAAEAQGVEVVCWALVNSSEFVHVR